MDYAVYRLSEQAAMERGETDKYMESLNNNITCADTINMAITDSYLGNFRYDLRTAVKSAVDQHGSERVSWVLANTLERKDFDGRFSEKNKEWAKTFPIPDCRQNVYYVVNAHPALLDAFIRYHREGLQLNKAPEVKKPSARGELQKEKGTLQQSTREKAPEKTSIEI